MLTQIQNHQLNQLVTTVNQLTADSISEWHKTLAEEVYGATTQIQNLTIAATQSALVGDMVKSFDKKQKAMLQTLEPPLRALGTLAESGHLTDAQKTKLFMELGRTYELLTEWDAALDRFGQALDYAADDLHAQATIHGRMGRIRSRQGNFPAANRHYRTCLEAFSQLNDLTQVAQTHINIGFNHFRQNEYTDAETNYKDAIKIAQSAEAGQRQVADAEMNLAILETVRGDFPTAESYYQRSIESYTTTDDVRGLAQAHYNLAMLLVDMSEWKKAGESYQKSLEYAQKWGDLHLVGHVYLSWTELALKMSDYTLAQACCMHAIKTFGRLGNQSALVDAYRYAAQIQHRQKNFDKACLFFERSIQMAETCSSRLNLAEAHHAYGLCLTDKLEAGKAQEQLDKALALFTELEAKADVENVQAAIARLNESEQEFVGKPRFKRIGQ